MVKVLPHQLQNTRLFASVFLFLVAHVQIINDIDQFLAILRNVEILTFSLQRELKVFKDVGCCGPVIENHWCNDVFFWEFGGIS